MKLLVAIASAAVASVMLMPATRASAADDLSGIWWAAWYNPSIKAYLIGDQDVPLNDAGKKKYAEIQAGLKSGGILDRARTYCTPDGIPRALSTPYPFQIIAAPPGQMSIVYEQNRMIRGISMVKPLDPLDKLAILPFWNGHSAGRWEGEILVIDTAGFNENTFLDATGLPHSDQLKTTERLRRLDAGKRLEDVVTIHDPVYYTRDFVARYVYENHSDIRMEEYVCGETHRDISKISGINEARAANARARGGR
jgi:hypothetical protein